MEKDQIVIGKEYNFKVFNEKVKVVGIDEDGTIVIKTDYGTINTYPKDLEELRK